MMRRWVAGGCAIALLMSAVARPAIADTSSLVPAEPKDGSATQAAVPPSGAAPLLAPANEAMDTYARGLKAYTARQWDEAIRWWRQTVRLDPSSVPGQLGLGVALLQRGLTTEAEAAFRAALARDPHDADAWANLGTIALQRGESLAAIDYYRKAVGCEPTDASLWVDWAGSYANAGNLLAAQAAALNALAFQPEYAEEQALLERLDEQLLTTAGAAESR